MSEHEVRLLVAASIDQYDQLEAALLSEGLDDAYVGATDDILHVDFAREAKSMTEAILSAIRDLRSVGFPVQRVASDELVTAAEVARRVGRTRESVRLLASGARGPGGFPAPVSRRMRSRQWRWAEVARWLECAGILAGGSGDDAKAIAAVNGALELVRNTASERRRRQIINAVQV